METITQLTAQKKCVQQTEAIDTIEREREKHYFYNMYFLLILI